MRKKQTTWNTKTQQILIRITLGLVRDDFDASKIKEKKQLACEAHSEDN